jgi:hypothetical protein
MSNLLWLNDYNRTENEEEYSQRIQNDLINSKRKLESLTQKQIIGYAYPFGDFGQNSINNSIATTTIYSSVSKVYPLTFYQVWQGLGNNFNYPSNNPLFIKRISIKPDWSGKDLLNIMDNQRNKNLPYKLKSLDNSAGWQQNWGNLTFDKNKMISVATASTTGSTVLLDGAYLWKDYHFSSQIDWVNGKSFALIIRMENDQNFASCTYTPHNINIEEWVNGKQQTLLSKNVEDIHYGYGLNVEARVNKNIITCLWGNSIVATSTINSILTHGGIGFKTWDPKAGVSKVGVRSLSINGNMLSLSELLNGDSKFNLPTTGTEE